MSIQKKSKSSLSVSWNSGEVTEISFLDLRYACKCAECVDEWTRERRIKKEQIPASIYPLKVELVGRYAVQLVWSDSHRAGIYPFDLLYSIAKKQESE